MENLKYDLIEGVFLDEVCLVFWFLVFGGGIGLEEVICMFDCDVFCVDEILWVLVVVGYIEFLDV